jgi:hypothetical protein
MKYLILAFMHLSNINVFANAPRKESYMVKGGGPISADPCQHQHWHGFIGIEEGVTFQISNWIKMHSN